jgi:hypothetical protein
MADSFAVVKVTYFAVQLQRFQMIGPEFRRPERMNRPRRAPKCLAQFGRAVQPPTVQQKFLRL